MHKFHLLIFTPQSHRGDTTSHLLEHCVCAPYHSTYKDFIQLYPSTEAKTLNFYTQFSFEKKEDLDRFLPFLTKKIKKSDYTREIKRLKDELLDPSFFDRLWTTLFGKQDRKYPSYSELLTYQERGYAHYWIVDENYVIVQKAGENTVDNTVDNTAILSSQRISLDKVDYFLLSIPFKSAKEWYLFDFFHRLSGAWIDYQTRYVEGLYFPYQFYQSCKAEAGYLIYAKGAYEHIKVLDQKFFNSFKSYYLEKNISHKGNILAQMLNKKTEDPHQVISNITFSQIQKLLK